uniref:DUF1330 domain-containing protein n=1 Tax=Bursaphelenchus xylophilus TaxID=6326 RepID=A0A1I7SW12_BURXY
MQIYFEFHRNSPNMIKALESRARGDYDTYSHEAAKVFGGFIKKYKDLPEDDRLILFHLVPEVDEMLSDPNLLKFVDEFNDYAPLQSSTTLLISFILMFTLY